MDWPRMFTSRTKLSYLPPCLFSYICFCICWDIFIHVPAFVAKGVAGILLRFPPTKALKVEHLLWKQLVLSVQ